MPGPAVAPNEAVVFKTTEEGTRRVVTQRDDDLLTSVELQQHKPEVEAAMLKELQTWAKLKCFSRKQRSQARNIIDTKWVVKWKFELPTVDVDQASRGSGSVEARGKANNPPKSTRTIRARLTVRGFKDSDRNTIDRCAGTSARSSQKVLVSEAVRRRWDTATTDISKAFLQGVTYEELAKLTGEQVREVNFYLPAAMIPLLRKVPGFEDFNPREEVLHCDKPGTGLVDAPRAFSIKLGLVTKNKCGLIPSKVDPELCYKHEPTSGSSSVEAGGGELVCLMTKHVDDLKITGRPDVVRHVLGEIQKVFGELKIIWHDFTNCGVRHVQCPRTKQISLDQVAFANALRPISHPQLRGKNEDPAPPDLHQLYMSLLGAVAYLAHTRADALVFISALQRFNSKPLIIHVKRLNRLLRWIQTNPKKLSYKPLTSGGSSSVEAGSHLRIVSDAAFKREGETGHALRGALFLLAPGKDDQAFTKSAPCHLLEWVCKG